MPAHDYPENPAEVLTKLSSDTLERMLRFSKTFDPDNMISTSGILPSIEQVVAVRHWIENQAFCNATLQFTPLSPAENTGMGR